MRVLLLMRHAKSSWKDDSLDDHDRPLNKRGRRDAPRMASKLKDLGWVPDVVLSSSSARTVETWARMKPSFPDLDAKLDDELYLCDEDDLRAALAELPDSCKTALVLGHNPGWEDAVEALTGEPVHMTTANVARLEVGGTDSWASATKARWNLTAVLRPKELDDAAD